MGGVTPDNIITHPSRSRNKALAELLAALRVAEREGIGVDRMTRDMIRVGHAAPEIVEIPGPYVRATLVGGDVDDAWVTWLKAITPDTVADNLNFLLVLRHLVLTGWIDPVTTARVIQDSVTTARGVLTGLSKAFVDAALVLDRVGGVPDDQEPVWRLSQQAIEALRRRDEAAGPARAWPSRASIAISYAEHRGRISSTELASLTGQSPSNVGGVLRQLEQEGILHPAWPSHRGRGFHYLRTSRTR